MEKFYYSVETCGRCVGIGGLNSKTLVYRIPYQEFKKENGYDEVDRFVEKNNFIVYILRQEKQDGPDVIYVGKSINGLKNRPNSHEGNWNWTYCYILTQHNQRTFLNDGLIQHIENELKKHIKSLNHYHVETVKTNTGTANAKEIELCAAYLEEVYDMLGILGLELRINYSDEEESSEPVNENDDPSNTLRDGVYHMSRQLKCWQGNVAQGRMRVTEGKYIVLSESQICPIEGPGLNDSVRAKRQAANIIQDKLMEDVVVDSPSAAAQFIVGCAANGWAYWTDESGKKIGDQRNNQ